MTVRVPIVFMVVISLYGCSGAYSDKEVKTSRYASYEEASRSGALASGWLPKSLPRSATDIVETHNLDTSEIWVTFNLSSEDVQLFRQGCRYDPSTSLPNARRARSNTTWWTKEITEGKNEELSGGRWKILYCPTMNHAMRVIGAGVVIDLVGNVVWYWVDK